MRGLLAVSLSVALAGCTSAAPSASPTEQIIADVLTTEDLISLTVVAAKDAPNLTINFTKPSKAEYSKRVAEELTSDQRPESFQVDAGAAVADYVASGLVADISSLYYEFGFAQALPQSLSESLLDPGHTYVLPVRVHKANLLWGNSKLLKKAGLPGDNVEFADLSAFLDALELVAKTSPGKAALAVGEEKVSLLENVLIADLGADGYKQLFTGGLAWEDELVKAALEDFGRLLAYAREYPSWEEAGKAVFSGEAALAVGDDSFGALASGEEGKDYAVGPTPGTAGTFDFFAESFTFVTGSPNPAGAKAWLGLAASVDGQEAFNEGKTSIPARTDVPRSSMSQAQSVLADSYAEDEVVGSLQHGGNATTAQRDATAAAVDKFAKSTRDEAAVAQLQLELATAFA
ncbi:MAG: ABC transporter substrate-binding protein [Propionibacteriaceae bacterium]|jgi:glucose/mannose transport system substrate-binding protein|nr:ABC transporter substrate-binding protein [Propionibacteriaceae bacterium]